MLKRIVPVVKDCHDCLLEKSISFFWQNSQISWSINLTCHFEISLKRTVAID